MKRVIVLLLGLCILLVLTISYSIIEGMELKKISYDVGYFNLWYITITAIASFGSFGTLIWLIYERNLNKNKLRLEEAISHRKFFYQFLSDIEESVENTYKFNKYKTYKMVYGNLVEESFKKNVSKISYKDGEYTLDWMLNEYDKLYYISKRSDLESFAKDFFIQIWTLMTNLDLKYDKSCHAGDFLHRDKYCFNVLMMPNCLNTLQAILSEFSTFTGRDKLNKRIELNDEQRDAFLDFCLGENWKESHNSELNHIVGYVSLMPWRRLSSTLSNDYGISSKQLKELFRSPMDITSKLGGDWYNTVFAVQFEIFEMNEFEALTQEQKNNFSEMYANADLGPLMMD